MNEKQEKNQKTIFQIAFRVYLISTPVLILLSMIPVGLTVLQLEDVFMFILVGIPIIGLLILPFGLVGGAIGRKKIDTQRAIRTSLMSFILILVISIIANGWEYFSYTFSGMIITAAFSGFVVGLFFGSYRGMRGIIENENLPTTRRGTIIGSVIGIILVLFIVTILIFGMGAQ